LDVRGTEHCKHSPTRQLVQAHWLQSDKKKRRRP